MTDKPVLTTFGNPTPIDIQKYKRYLPTAFDESLSLLEKVNMVIDSENNLLNVMNDVVTQVNNVQIWALGDGLWDDVNKKLDDMLADGTLESIVNGNLIPFSKYKPTGDGVADDTTAFQNALNDLAGTGKTLYIAKPSVKYKIGKIIFPSNVSLYIAQGTIFEAVSGAFPNETDKMLDLMGKSNIFISGYGATFQGLKSEYTTGEWRHIFNLQGVKDVYIEGVSANDGGGDGFYVGWDYCENVFLVDCKADNNRRNNFSVTNGKNLNLIRPIATNANGTNPQAGIDLEAESSDNSTIVVDQWRIVNPYTYKNIGGGIALNVNQIVNYGINVDMVIDNHLDDGSAIGFDVYGGVGVVNGRIKVNNPLWKYNTSNGFSATNYDSRFPNIVVTDPTVIDCNKGNYVDSYKWDSGFACYRPSDSTNTAPAIGNVHLIRPTVIDTRQSKITSASIYFRDELANGKVEKCLIVDPIRLDYKNVMLFYNATNSPVKDGNEVLTLSDTYYTFDITGFGYYKRRDNTNATATITYNLKSTAPIGLEVEFVVNASQMITIQPDATEQIFPSTTAVGKYLQSNVVGSRVTIKKLGTGKWVITNIVGTWTAQA